MFLSGRPLALGAWRKLGLIVGLALAVCAQASVEAKGPLPAQTESIGLAELPREARATERLIREGGPFPHGKDGIVFGNRERLLPTRPRGFYREYTVPTPGASTRGARRIVCGGTPPTQPETCFYTGDHYASFKRITP